MYSEAGVEDQNGAMSGRKGSPGGSIIPVSWMARPDLRSTGEAPGKARGSAGYGSGKRPDAVVNRKAQSDFVGRRHPGGA